MTARTDAQDDLRSLRHKPLHLLRYLDDHSGLPGPRANLTLVEAFGDVADAEMILQLAGSPDAFRRLCGAAALGRLWLEDPEDPVIAQRLRLAAEDDDQRVRDGAAMALQRIGDAAPERLRELVTSWLTDASPRVVRAAVAGVCEPRLLRDDATRRAALASCATATQRLLATPAEERRSDECRTLRQALGYCWSVAIAGFPEEGMPAFAALRKQAAETADADLVWIVSENLANARLKRLVTR